MLNATYRRPFVMTQRHSLAKSGPAAGAQETQAGAVIIGGGIAGLAAAYRLSTLLPGHSITVIERDTRLGGKLQTETIDGFVLEGGPESFLAAKPHATRPLHRTRPRRPATRD